MNTDAQLLKALQRKDEKAICNVYDRYYTSVEKYILSNSGSTQDAEDVFQDTVLIVLSSIEKEDFELRCSVKTFIFAIARKVWLKHLRNNTRIDILQEIAQDQWDFFSESEEIDRIERQYNSIPEVLKRISAHCSGLLKELFLTGKIPDHYKNNHSLRNQKYKCLQQARKMAEKINLPSLG